MRNRTYAIVLIAVGVVSGAGTVHALTLQRLVATVDMGRLASSTPVASNDAASLRLEPLTASLSAPTTEFLVHLPSEAVVMVEVTNDVGDCVCNARMVMPAGVQKLGFSGRAADGAMLPNGEYRYSVIAGGAMQTARVLIAR